MEHLPIIISVAMATAAIIARMAPRLTEQQMKILLSANNERADSLRQELEKRDDRIAYLSDEIHSNKTAMLELHNRLLSALLEIETLKGLIYQHLGEEGGRKALEAIDRAKRATAQGKAIGKADIIKYIEDGYLEKAIETAIAICHGCEAANDLTAISGRYSELMRKVAVGDVANTDALRERNAIRMALLEVIDGWA